MHFAIRFLTRYEYDADVVDNINTLRVRPAGNSPPAGRRLHGAAHTPERTAYTVTEDYFGTEVVEFEVVRAHRELVIDVRARVTTQPQREPSGTTWEELSDQAYREAWRRVSTADGGRPRTPAAGRVGGRGRGPPRHPLAAVLLRLRADPRTAFEYRKGATYVDSPLTDVLDGRAGVCQDFVHLGLNLLRRHGIAARYVSGYLYTTGQRRTAPPTRQNESVEVDTHAWIDALLPVEDGEPLWVSIDPTNRGLAGERHVKIGHGRHYADVPPIKGVYRGVAHAKLEASVTMTRSEGPDPASAARG